MNALMLASQRGHGDLVALLIQHKACMDEQTGQGSTALMLACKRGHEKCAQVCCGVWCMVYKHTPISIPIPIRIPIHRC
ncbi:ankyrin repeat domain-containing protein [archaeon]|nr:MAG: ankyrin repeat domain-containing protein [archaeon]